MQKEKKEKDLKAHTPPEKAAGQPETAEEERAGQQPEPEPESTAGPEEELQRKLDETNAQLAKQKDLLLRTAAEYDNYRKRTAREKAVIYNDATAAAVQEILSVADSLERALEQRECTADDMRKGVEMVERQMLSALSKLGVEEMGAEGDPFDPAVHNAISHVEDENSGENVVTKVFQKGYRIGERVIRHAMVQVAN